MLSSWKKRLEFTSKMHLVGTREPHSLLVGIVFTTCCFKLRWPLPLQECYDNVPRSKCQKISHECKVNQSYTSSGKSVVRRLWRVFFCRLAVKYNDGIWDRKLKLCLSKSQDNNNNNNINNNNNNNINNNNNNNNNDNNNNNTTNNNVYSALFSYSFIALYNDYAK